ncbi:hypothetical protein LV84_01665 [Algoriphagus ratkowskyi]|uniref:Uncharacterized protein n=1 Tax=Algoriphagus ratkowskyi TaxID=57028 RepID=A0A2W7RT43_9BACT|nr:hypothetical protein LV84_01665 [Algoriphagus ratkowskyi]
MVIAIIRPNAAQTFFWENSEVIMAVIVGSISIITISQKTTQKYNWFKISALCKNGLNCLFDYEHQKVRDGQLFVKE